MTYRHIYAAIELQSSNTVVIERADRLAKRCGARLTVATCVPDLKALYRGTEHRMQEDFDHTMVTAAEQDLAALCQKARVTPERLEVVRGEPEVSIVVDAHQRRADLLAFGNHDRHGLDHYVGGFGLGLLHRAHCDLLAVNLAHADVTFASPLAALADDDDDAKVLRRTLDLSRSVCAAVHVLRPPWLQAWSSDMAQAEERTNIATKIRTQLAERLAELASVDLQVTFDTPSRGIEAAAEQGQHDLIVMGSGSHSQLGWHLGSTAHNLLSLTRRDVLLIRPAQKE